ncbi:MAG TPA: S41 family peptidase [Vicinamibacteria bacterium]|nr:S41 family peptidase [Vicinamibacteria bacterium]
MNSRPRRPLAIMAVSILAVLPACGGGSSSSSPSDASTTDTCSTLGQVTFVRNTLQDIYFWYKQLSDPAPSGFASPEAYLEAVRYKTLDHTYSYIADKAESAAFFSESQFIGIGLSTQFAGESDLRIAQVFPGSPASDAGLERGDYVLTINGKAVADLIRTGEIDTIFGASTIGVVVTMTWRNFASGDTREATLTKRAVTIPTVSDTQVYDVRRGPRVGYVFFRNFVTPSTAALDTAFSTLKAAGAEELVLDLRYNGGGLVSVAQHLASLIGATATSGQTFIEFFHNDKNQSRNSTLRFDVPAQAIGFSRLVVITTRGSASASEGVINGLRPFMPVTLVGDTTYGKPVGQYGYDFCDKTLYPVAFETRNARGEGDYYTGLPADCAAADDLDHQLGDPDEGSLAEAIEYLRTGTCTATASVAAKAHAARQARHGSGQPKDGFRQLVGAY